MVAPPIRPTYMLSDSPLTVVWSPKAQLNVLRSPPNSRTFRASSKIKRGSAARHFGGSLGGPGGASPTRAATPGPTTAPGKRAAAQRVFVPKAVWCCCGSLTGRFGHARSPTPSHTALGAKTEPLLILLEALKAIWRKRQIDPLGATGLETALVEPSVSRSYAYP